MGIVLGFVTQGLIYALVAFGIYITFQILDFPDLTVDGSFPLGAAVTALMLVNGFNPWLTLPVSFFVGAAAGLITGIIHVKCRVRDFLAGITVMTGLYSINLLISGKANVPLYNTVTIFKSRIVEAVFPESMGNDIKKMIVLLVIAVICKLAMDFYMSTRSGYLLRAAGDNPILVTSLARDKGQVKILGLALANGLVALGGCIMAQEQGYFDLSMGTGTMVIALASLVMGLNILKYVRFAKGTSAAILGCIIYRALWAAAIASGLDAVYMKLVTAVLLLVFLMISMDRKKKVKKHA